MLTALGGMLYVNGFPNHAPVRPLGLQAYHSSAYFGAIAMMFALFARDRTGEGQWIDLSMQEATAAAVEHVAGRYFERNEAEPRRGTLHWSRFFRVGKCRDGYIMHCTLGDWTSLIEWVKSDGKAADLDDARIAGAAVSLPDAEHLFDVLDEWVKDYPRDELLERAQLLRLPYATVRPPEALFDDEQLAERGYFVEVEHPELGRTFRYPGAPYLFNGTPWRVTRRPPLVGEHTGEILRDELAMAPEDRGAHRRRSDLTWPRCRSKVSACSTSPGWSPGRWRRAFSADHGAEVIKVERKDPPPLGIASSACKATCIATNFRSRSTCSTRAASSSRAGSRR